MGNLTAKKAMKRASSWLLSTGWGASRCATPTIGCGAERMGGRRRRPAASGYASPTRCPHARLGSEGRTNREQSLVLAIPRKNGEHIVVDMAVAQYSYGKIEEARLANRQLPYPGGFDSEGSLTTDPKTIERTRRVLPIGYWKGSALALALDAVASVLSGGNSTQAIGKLCKDEIAISQTFIAIDPYRLDAKEEAEAILEGIIDDLKRSEPIASDGSVFYPGERTIAIRRINAREGIPVTPGVWDAVMASLNTRE